MARACPEGRLDNPRPCPLPRPWARGAAAWRSRTAACGAELQGALRTSGPAGAWRARQGALRVRAPGRPARATVACTPARRSWLRWRTLRAATEAGTLGGECGARRVPSGSERSRGSRLGGLVSRVSGDDPGGVSLMPGSGGRDRLPNSGCEPHHQALSLIYALPNFHLSLYPSPRRGSPPSDLCPLSQPRTLEACLHTPFLPQALPRLPPPGCQLPASLPSSFAPTVPAATLAGSHSAPVLAPRDCSRNRSSGIPLLPAVPNLRCPGKGDCNFAACPGGEAGSSLATCRLWRRNPGPSRGPLRTCRLSLLNALLRTVWLLLCLLLLGELGYVAISKRKPALSHTNMEQVFLAAASGFQLYLWMRKD